MTIVRAASAVALSVGAVLFATAATANADPGDMDGAYTITTNAGHSGTWTFTSCGPGCAHVSSAPTPTWAPYAGDAHLAGSQWVLTVDRPDAQRCKDNSVVPGTSTFSWDDGTLNGTLTSTIPKPCPGGVAPTATFTLAKVG
jgi:hypothetical protein